MTNQAATGASPALQHQELSQVPSQSMCAAPTRAPSLCSACRANEHSGLHEAGRMGEEEEGEERCQTFTHALDIIFLRGP